MISGVHSHTRNEPSTSLVRHHEGSDRILTIGDPRYAGHDWICALFAIG